MVIHYTNVEPVWRSPYPLAYAPLAQKHRASFLSPNNRHTHKIALRQRLWVGHLRSGQTTDFIMPHLSRRYLTTPQEVAASFATLFMCPTLRNTSLKHVLELSKR